jgi:hypothetical protein
MKTYDEAVYLALEACWYGDCELREGALVLERHGAVRHMPENFERLSDDDKRVARFFREREVVRETVERLDRDEARDRVRKQRERTGRQSEAAFWRDTARLLGEAETRGLGLDELPDPALEEEEEKIAEEQRLARLRNMDDEQFWDEAIAQVERAQAAEMFPAEVRKAVAEEEARRRGK